MYWILKSEPEVYSWSDLLKDGRTRWDGVRNFQARNNLRVMKVDDWCFFYHSGKQKEIVGLAKVVKTAYPDTTTKEGDWVAVDITPIKALKKPLPLSLLKSVAGLKNLALIRQGRLSVSPVSEAEAKIILSLGR